LDLRDERGRCLWLLLTGGLDDCFLLSSVAFAFPSAASTTGCKFDEFIFKAAEDKIF